MSNVDVVRDAPRADLAPVDPNVVIPDHVKKAAALAERFYAKTEPAPEAPNKEALVQPPQPEPIHAREPEHLKPEVQPQPEVKPAVSEESWEHRYLSMQGRWRNSQNTIGQMQEQMSQLGDELVRTQSLVEAARGAAPQEPQRGHDHKKLITDEDEKNDGNELIDLGRRAARETVGPEIEALRNENRSLTQRVTTSAQKDISTTLNRVVPNWVGINRSPEFKNWLRLPNIYTGQVRSQMLNAAYQAADAPQVAEFFQDFRGEGVAAGQMQPAPQNEQLQEPVAPSPAPRQAAMTLEALVAPGRARPATGDANPGPAETPFFTRAQVAGFYNDVRKGAFAGREVEKSRIENQIFAAQNSQRIKG